jgi:hypothetical protein
VIFRGKNVRKIDSTKSGKLSLFQELIGQGLDTLWMAVHSVQGIMFKDLKQILRKEQVRKKWIDTMANFRFRL